MFKRTTVVNTSNEQEVGADILNKNDRRLEVALDRTNLKLVLTKKTPHQAYYVGTVHGMEFTSTGE